MRGGGGTYLSGDLIMEGVRRAGHRLKMDRRTLGDGNCFPRAAKQQCDRLAVEINSIQSHTDLRGKVTNYMHQSKDKVVVDMRRRWDELEVRWSWKSYWQRMARDTEWVEEPFIWATAWFLERDIWIVWDTATPKNLLTFFSGDREGNGNACPGVPMIIGHHTDTHYQSLLPEGDPVSISLDIRGFAAEVNTTLEALQRKNRSSKRKDAPEDESNTDTTILTYGPGKPGVKARRMHDAGVEYTCLLCKADQKQIASHIKKKHADMFQKEELEELLSSLKKFATAAANFKKKRQWKARDPEGFMKTKKLCEARRILKRRAEDLDAVKQNNRKWKNKCVAKKKQENPKEVKEREKRENDARKGNGEKKFKAEQTYGHIFPCACCHTMKSRDQVVELNPQQMDKIEGKAREFHQTLQVNSYTYTCD